MLTTAVTHHKMRHGADQSAAFCYSYCICFSKSYQCFGIKLADVVDNALICMQTVNEKKDSYRFRFQLRQTVISRYTDYAVGSSVI